MESSQTDLHNGVNHNGEETKTAQGVSIIGNNDFENGDIGGRRGRAARPTKSREQGRIHGRNAKALHTDGPK